MAYSYVSWSDVSDLPLPFFDGANVSAFLRAFDEFCDDYEHGDQWRASRVPRFCSRNVSMYVRSLPEYAERDSACLRASFSKSRSYSARFGDFTYWLAYMLGPGIVHTN